MNKKQQGRESKKRGSDFEKRMINLIASDAAEANKLHEINGEKLCDLIITTQGYTCFMECKATKNVSKFNLKANLKSYQLRGLFHMSRKRPGIKCVVSLEFGTGEIRILTIEEVFKILKVKSFVTKEETGPIRDVKQYLDSL